MEKKTNFYDSIYIEYACNGERNKTVSIKNLDHTSIIS